MAQHALQVLLNDSLPQGVAQTNRRPADRRPISADCALTSDLTLTEVQRRIAAGRWFGGAELTTSAGILSMVAHLPDVPPPSEPTPLPSSTSYFVGLRTTDAGTVTLVGHRGTRN